MRNMKALAAFAACFLAPLTGASAATVQLDGITANALDYTYLYGGTLAPTEGIRSGSKLVIVDFAGYVDGSVFSPVPFITASTELTTSGLLMSPGTTDNASLVNLVFTYTGPDFQTTPAPFGLPYTPIDFSGLGARSTLGQITLDAFATLTVKNEGTAVGTDVYATGLVGVPGVPEPASWAMMILGMGTIGATMRRRPQTRVAFS